MAQPSYTVRLTGPQLRVLHELLSPVLNDPSAMDLSQRDLNTLSAAHEKIITALRSAWRAESTPAVRT
jgi:hypothetical protein